MTGLQRYLYKGLRGSCEVDRASKAGSASKAVDRALEASVRASEAAERASEIGGGGERQNN